MILIVALSAVLAGVLVQQGFGTAPVSAPLLHGTPAATATAVVALAATVSSTPSSTAVPVATAHATATSTAAPSSTAPPSPAAPRATPPARTPTAGAAPLPTAPGPRRCAGVVPPCPPNTLLPGTVLIADQGNNRLIEVNAAKQIVWAFPRPGDLLAGQVFLGPDDAFFTPGGQAIITNQETAQTIGRIDYHTHRLMWQYGQVGVRGSTPGQLNEPDDAYQLRNGLVTVADIRNCRILFLSPAGTVVRQYGQTGVCAHDPPHTFASPNGDTPLPDGGMLVTEIGGSHIVRLSAAGRVLFDITVPRVSYASDAQLLADGSVLVADYSEPGGIVRVSSAGQLLWRYTPTRAADVLNHPSLALMLPNGLIAANDDWNHRVVLIDPRRQTIVWQYGVTGVPGIAPGYLNTPDGIDFRSATAP